jgi:hypothetical protein
MNETPSGQIAFDVLSADSNKGYLSKPIPGPRDEEISILLRQIIEQRLIARVRHTLLEEPAMVLRAFAERMASAAVRQVDSEILRMGLIALLLAWRGPDCRNTLVIFPLFYDAILKLGLDRDPFIASIRRVLGDELISPFIDFLDRPEGAKSLQAMGYIEGSDGDGFRYVRNW